MPARQPSVSRPVLTAGPASAPHYGGGAPHAGATFFLVTCEHGGKRVPAAYRGLFVGREALLTSHRGHDPGALIMARDLATALHAPLVSSTISRLLVDLNRSPGHRARFSEITRPLSPDERAVIHARYYEPYRRRVERTIANAIRHGARVVHISSHSFTPVLDGRVRSADVGFLYDPARHGEVQLSARWMAALEVRDRSLRLRRNYPYTGRADGFCTWLRRQYPPESYVGIELEVNQRYATSGGPAWAHLRAEIVAALLHAVGERKSRAPGEAVTEEARRAQETRAAPSVMQRQAAPSSTA